MEVWDLASGRKLQSFPGVPHAYRVAFSPDGRLLAVSGGFGNATVWDTTDGRKIHDLTSTGALVFHPGGRWVAAGEGARVSVRDAETGALVRQFATHGGRATFSPDGTVIAVSGPEAVEILNAETGKEIARLPHGARESESRHERFFAEEGADLAFSPDGRLVAVATNPPRIWDRSTGQVVHSLVGHAGLVLGIAFSPDGRQVATAGADTTIRLWDVQNGEQREILRGHAEFVSNVAFHPEGWCLLSGGRRAGELKVWDLTRDREYRSLHNASSQALAFDPAGRLHSLHKEGRLQTFDLGTGRLLRGNSLDLTRKWLTPAVIADFSDDGGRLATIPQDGLLVKVWNAETGQAIATLKGLECPAMAVDCNRDGSRVAALGMKGLGHLPSREVHVWDVASGNTLVRFSPRRWPIRYVHGAVALSSDGERIAFDDYAGDTETTVTTRIRLHDVRDGRERHSLPFGRGRVTAIAFSPLGDKIAASDISGNLAVWNAKTGVNVGTTPTQQAGIFHLAFSPDGRRLAAVQRERVLVWDVPELQEMLVLRIASHRSMDGGYNPTVAWSHDGRKIANSNWDGRISVWDGPVEPISSLSRFEEARTGIFPWHLGEAEASVQEGNERAALFHLARLRASNPPDDVSRLRRARLLLRVADWTRAEEDFAACQSASTPDDGAAFLGARAPPLCVATWKAINGSRTVSSTTFRPPATGSNRSPPPGSWGSCRIRTRN